MNNNYLNLLKTKIIKLNKKQLKILKFIKELIIKVLNELNIFLLMKKKNSERKV